MEGGLGKWIEPDGSGRISAVGCGGGLSSFVKLPIPVAMSCWRITACGNEACDSLSASEFILEDPSVASKEAGLDRELCFLGWAVVSALCTRGEGGSSSMCALRSSR